MEKSSEFDARSAGAAYDRYMDRWSRLIAAEFLTWLDAPTGADWLDLGCGTGALTETILRVASPASTPCGSRSRWAPGRRRDTWQSCRIACNATSALPCATGSVATAQ